MKFCRGCGKLKPIVEFAINQSLDFECKSTRDKVYNIAKRQGELVWFHECTHNDTRFQILLATFKVKMAGQTAKQVPFVVARYKEVMETAQSLVIDDVGEMMSEEEYVDYLLSKRTNKCNALEATNQWKAMRDAPGAFVNKKVDEWTKKEVERVRVHIKDKVTSGTRALCGASQSSSARTSRSLGTRT